jgi:rod shape-determining protein MreB
MPGKIGVIKPLKDGVIADFKVTGKMLGYFIQRRDVERQFPGAPGCRRTRRPV